MNSTQKLERITLTADSGSVEHVIKKGELGSIDTLQSEMSTKNLKYQAANGTLIDNYGEKTFKGKSNEGHEVKMVLQVADVKRNLASIVQMVDDGNQSGKPDASAVGHGGVHLLTSFDFCFVSGCAIRWTLVEDGLVDSDAHRLEVTGAPIPLHPGANEVS